MRAVRVRSRHFNGRQPNGLNKNISVIRLRDKSSSGGEGGGLMRGIKIPRQNFALKMPGGLMREGGGRICRTLRYKFDAGSNILLKTAVVAIQDDSYDIIL